MKSWTARPKLEQIANLVFGLNVWCWAILTIAAAPEQQAWHPVRLCIAILHAVVGTLLLTRRPLLIQGQTKHMLAAVPALVLSGLAFGNAPDCTTWNSYAQTLFALGTCIAVMAFASLARNFAVLPAVRGVTTTGPYRFVRHPAYFGEMLLVAACVVANVDWLAILIAVATSVALVVRIRVEEQLLTSTQADQETYLQYCRDVPSRLIPGIW